MTTTYKGERESKRLPGVWGNRDTWEGRIQDSIAPGNLNDLVSYLEVDEGCNVPVVVSVGPSGFSEYDDLHQLKRNMFVLGIEADDQAVVEIEASLSKLFDRQKYGSILQGNGWDLGFYKNVLSELNCRAVVAFNSLGIAIHRNVPEIQKIPTINRFLDDAKEIIKDSGCIIISVGTGVFMLEIRDGKYYFYPHKSYEVVFDTTNGQTFVTDMWKEWIDALKTRDDVVVLDREGNNIEYPRLGVNRLMSTLKYQTLVPCSVDVPDLIHIDPEELMTSN